MDGLVSKIEIAATDYYMDYSTRETMTGGKFPNLILHTHIDTTSDMGIFGALPQTLPETLSLDCYVIVKCFEHSFCFIFIDNCSVFDR